MMWRLLADLVIPPERLRLGERYIGQDWVERYRPSPKHSTRRWA